MPYNVLPAEDEDMTTLFTIGSRAFADNEPFWDATYPNHKTPEGRAKGGQRFLEAKQGDPHVRYCKAVDESNGEIVGFARWLLYKDYIPKPAPYGDHWEDPEEAEYVGHLLDEFLAVRGAFIEKTGGNVVCLDICAIDPDHQRKGIGGKLVAWGTQKADEMGIDAVVESSVFGKGLYEKNGYVFQRDVELPVPEKFAHRPKSRFAWLIRAKRPDKGVN